ncbi:MAG: pkar1 [Thermoleophilia bacterium]|nr:pkar1 [Thermoleophilia bacterium]
MPTERTRHAFLRELPLLARAGADAVWNLAYAGHEQDVAGKSTWPTAQEDTTSRASVGIVRSGEFLVISFATVTGDWIDGDGLTRCVDGSRVAIDPVTGGRVVGRLHPGDLFGASTLVPAHVRGATLRAASGGVTCTLFDALEFHLELAHSLLATPELFLGNPDEPVDARPLTLYNDLPMRDLAIVKRDARLEEFRAGDAIVTRGDTGDRFYLVLRGSAIVERDGATLASLGRGDHFGELALLTDAPRAATVRAVSTMQTWSVSREAFERIIAVRLGAGGDAATRDLAAGRGPGGAMGSALAARLRSAR